MGSVRQRVKKAAKVTSSSRNIPRQELGQEPRITRQITSDGRILATGINMQHEGLVDVLDEQPGRGGDGQEPGEQAAHQVVRSQRMLRRGVCPFSCRPSSADRDWLDSDPAFFGA